jgi:hypothetical protein
MLFWRGSSRMTSLRPSSLFWRSNVVAPFPIVESRTPLFLIVKRPGSTCDAHEFHTPLVLNVMSPIHVTPYVKLFSYFFLTRSALALAVVTRMLQVISVWNLKLNDFHDWKIILWVLPKPTLVFWTSWDDLRQVGIIQ